MFQTVSTMAEQCKRISISLASPTGLIPKPTIKVQKKVIMFFSIGIFALMALYFRLHWPDVYTAVDDHGAYYHPPDAHNSVGDGAGARRTDSTSLDIHVDDPGLGHTGETQSALAPVHGLPSRIKIAVGGAITSRGISVVTVPDMESNFLEFSILLPSFCRTASLGYDYHFYHAYDVDDPVLTRPGMVESFHNVFYKTFRSLCPPEMSISLHMIQCNHTHNPAWAQNDAMFEAYLDGAEYFYRLNDDSSILTAGWTQSFISTLRRYDPPNVGVVGPYFDTGNTDILTHDFVHRTHLEIFGCYYPRVFTDWWADDWITTVYQPGRSTKVKEMMLKHTQKLGQRYGVKVNRAESGDLKRQLLHDAPLLLRYIDYRQNKIVDTFPNMTKVIAMSLYGRDPRYTLGAIRNAQLLPVVFPGWMLHIYIANETTQKQYMVPPRILQFLDTRPEVTLIRVPATMQEVHPKMWRLLVIDDPKVDFFLIRDADERFSDREASAGFEWMRLVLRQQTIEDKAREIASVAHCMRDSKSHAATSLVSSLWGGHRQQVQTALTAGSVADLLHTIAISKGSLAASNRTFLEESDLFRDIAWSALKNRTYCHDSVSCNLWPNSHPFPRRFGQTATYVGQPFDAFNYPLNPEEVGSRETQCQESAQETKSLYRAFIQSNVF